MTDSSSAAYKALEAVRRMQSAYNLGDLIYTVKESEVQGWDGPRVTAWNEGAMLAIEALKESGTMPERIK
jgi:hypothetical protein